MKRFLIIFVAVLVVASMGVPVITATTETPTQPHAAQTSAEVACEYPLELTDATGETVSLEEPPESVVALGPSDAQTVYDIGAEDRLVGMPIVPATDGLDPGDRENVVADDLSVVTETVIDLDPDVVLAANITPHDTVDELRRAGLTVYQFDTATTIDDVRDNVYVTGALTDECEGATETVDWMDDRLDAVDEQIDDDQRPLAYYAMGDDGTTMGTATFQHEVLETAGLENLAERAGLVGWGEVSEETVLDEDPDVIVYPDYVDEPPMPATLEATTAFQNGNVVSVDDNNMSQPAPSVVYAIEELVAQTADIDVANEEETDGDDTTGTESDEETDGDESTDTQNDATDSDSDDDHAEDAVPGFSVSIAVFVLALSLVAIHARQH